MRFLALLCILAVPVTLRADASAPWAWRLGHSHPPRQASFCQDREAALEIAAIFDRFGPRTGFSALSSSPDCSTRILGVRPLELLRSVRVELRGGGHYEVRFIRVRASDGSEPVLVTTRRLTGK